MTTRPAAFCAALGLGLLALAGGCGQGGPKTYPVKGRVVVKNGDVKKLAGGFVRLQSVADPKLIGVGEIDEEGNFGVGAFIDGKPVGGLPEGEYRARVEPPGSEGRAENDDDKPPPPKKGDILPKYQAFDASGLKYAVKPGDNALTVEVEVRR